MQEADAIAKQLSATGLFQLKIKTVATFQDYQKQYAAA